MSPRPSSLLLALACALGAAVGAAAAASAAPAPAAAPATLADDVRLDAWPALEDEAAAKRELARLRKASTPEMAADAAARIREGGAAYGPLLLDALGKERDAEARERLVGALDAVTGAPHTRLLAAQFAAEGEPVRLYALRRVSEFPDPGLVDLARKHYVALEARAADPKAKHKPGDDELDSGARMAASAGALEGLPRCLAQAERDWRHLQAPLRAACAGCRGAAGTELLLGKLTAAGSDALRVAALNLLAVVGTRESVSSVRRYLDSDANNVRVAAINALRGIVDGDPPIKDLSVFSAIEEAKRWKERT